MAIGHNWILAFRTDFLTSIFMLAPFLAKDYFYIIIIAGGYWLRPSSLLFRSLGFLVPFSTLLNCLLKNLFRIPHPDISIHLSPIHDSFGFPSGDVQVAVIFWFAIFLNLKSNYYKYLCLLPVIIITMSRIYLGVHSVYDVIGGWIFGFWILYIWEKYLKRELLVRFFQYNYKKFWILVVIVISLYSLISKGLKWPPMVPMSIGCLIGFGLSLPWISDKVNITKYKLTMPMVLICLAIVIAIAKAWPVIRTNEFLFPSNIILKYAALVFGILVLIPSSVIKFAENKKYYRH